MASGRSPKVLWLRPGPIRDRAWVRTAIDAFLLARMEDAGFAPSPEAERTTLLRRLYLDLLGLPPQPDDMDEFLGDDRPDAW